MADGEVGIEKDSNFHKVGNGHTAWEELPYASVRPTVEFGDGVLANTNYIQSRGLDLVTNGTGKLRNNYNMPIDFQFDPIITPGLDGSFSLAGHYPGIRTISETLPINPNLVYRLSMFLYQEHAPGDWSAYPYGERHSQYMGLFCYDADGLDIKAVHHMFYKENGTSSRTVLTQPLTPGDTIIHVANSSGWNSLDSNQKKRGIIIFEYKNSLGYKYDHYSRRYQENLFDLGGVNKSSHQITLNKPFPVILGNPDDPNKTWPVGTKLANTNNGGYKYSLNSGQKVNETDKWYCITNFIGGIDLSGNNISRNFPPGTVSARIFWLPNYSNRAGGWINHPDTGSEHKIRFAGISAIPETHAMLEKAADGHEEIYVPTPDIANENMKLGIATRLVQEV